MAPPAASILDLSNELLRDVLDFIEADPDKLVSLDRRAYLSQESFKLPPHPAPDLAQVISNFRLVCKRFSELGAIHQYARITTRFSRAGFERLQKIASNEHLARHVRKFSYMVPYFYFQCPYLCPSASEVGIEPSTDPEQPLWTAHEIDSSSCNGRWVSRTRTTRSSLCAR